MEMANPTAPTAIKYGTWPPRAAQHPAACFDGRAVPRGIVCPSQWQRRSGSVAGAASRGQRRGGSSAGAIKCGTGGPSHSANDRSARPTVRVLGEGCKSSHLSLSPPSSLSPLTSLSLLLAPSPTSLHSLPPRPSRVLGKGHSKKTQRACDRNLQQLDRRLQAEHVAGHATCSATCSLQPRGRKGGLTGAF